MASQLTVRVTDSLARDVSTLARRMGLKRSDVVRMALQKFSNELQHEKESLPYDNVKHLLGSVSSGISDLGKNHRRRLLERFKKHA